MQPRPWPDVPELTARMARSSSPKGNLAMRIREELGEVYADARFAAAFGVRGRPGISPGQLMMASVLQFSENLTDRQAAEAVRDRMTWKYALGLELEDPGFDASVLSEFRSRLVAGLTSLALDALLERLAGLGLVKAGGRQRTDSTHVLGAIRDLNRLELAGETLRAALEALAAAAPGWLAGMIDESWQQVYGARIDDLHLPEGQARRRELMVRYGTDGYYLLERACEPAAPGWLRELPAVQALRWIWIQQFYREVRARAAAAPQAEAGQQRENGEIPPSHAGAPVTASQQRRHRPGLQRTGQGSPGKASRGGHRPDQLLSDVAGQEQEPKQRSQPGDQHPGSRRPQLAAPPDGEAPPPAPQ